MKAGEGRAPAHVVIVTPEAWGVTRENGGISTSVVHFARLFRRRGDRVTLVVGLAKEREPDPVWAERYASEGIELALAVADQVAVRETLSHALEFPFRRISEAVADAIPADADVVHFQDWSALGFEYLRRRGPGATLERPPVVTVLRSSSGWLREGALRPEDADMAAAASLDLAERFAVERSDYVVSPSRVYRNYVATSGVRLPGGDRTRVLGHPWFPDRPRAEPAARPKAFRRLILFGRLETLKGFDVFLDALRLLHARRPDLLTALDEVVLLGREGSHRQPSLDVVTAELRSFGSEAVVLSDLDSWQAQDYLADVASGSLVVIPSLRENFCNAAVEASLVPGLNLICSDVGGIPDVLGMPDDQLFSPTPESLGGTIERWLDRGPRPASELATYDWADANARWLDFHAEVLAAGATAPPRRAARTPSTALSVVVSTYEWPEALDAVLGALAEQSDDGFEIVVADDGSGPSTAAAVDRWREALGDRLVHVWQPDDGYRLARVRNLGAAAASGGYLVFLDGDCVPRRGFIAALRRAARSGWFLAGKRVQLSAELSRAVLVDRVPIDRWSIPRLLVRLRGNQSSWRDLTPRDRRRPWRPNLPDYVPENRAYGFLTGVTRADFELVDGFDTRYVGWGEQDVDLAVRLRRLGLRSSFAGPRATVLHLWHPTGEERDRSTWWLLQETEQCDRIHAVEGLDALVREEVAAQESANRAVASSSSIESANR